MTAASGSAVGSAPADGPPKPTPPSLRIAFFTDTFWPTHDGVATVTEALAAALVRAGHSVTVHTTSVPGRPRSERRADGVRVRRHASVPAPSYPQYRIAAFPYGPVASPGFGHRFDLVHVHTPGFVGLAGWMAARRHRLPLVATYHTHLEGMLSGAGGSRGRQRFYRAWSRFAVEICRGSDLATAPSEHALRVVADGQGTGRPRAARVVANGVDTRRFRPDAPGPDWKRRLGAGSSPLVTFLGRWTRDKGVERFLSALEDWETDIPFVGVVAGEGPLAPVLRERLKTSERFRDRLRDVGPVREEEKPSLLAQSHVFVLPSLSDTSSVALLEAMASGAACVVTSSGGPAEIARSSGAATIVDPLDRSQIRAAVERYLRVPELAREHGRAARAWVEANASVDQVARELVLCYRATMARSIPVDA